MYTLHAPLFFLEYFRLRTWTILYNRITSAQRSRGYDARVRVYPSFSLYGDEVWHVCPLPLRNTSSSVLTVCQAVTSCFSIHHLFEIPCTCVAAEEDPDRQQELRRAEITREHDPRIFWAWSFYMAIKLGLGVGILIWTWDEPCSEKIHGWLVGYTVGT